MQRSQPPRGSGRFHWYLSMQSSICTCQSYKVYLPIFSEKVNSFIGYSLGCLLWKLLSIFDVIVYCSCPAFFLQQTNISSSPSNVDCGEVLVQMISEHRAAVGDWFICDTRLTHPEIITSWSFLGQISEITALILSDLRSFHYVHALRHCKIHTTDWDYISPHC